MTEQQLRRIIAETVEEVLTRTGLINEMAVPLKKYKQRVDALRFQLVENWCLCKWCQLFDRDNENISHWSRELKTCIDNLKLIDIKNGISKKKTLLRMLVEDYDYNSPEMIERIIRGKFNDEGMTNEAQKYEVCSEFAFGIGKLIDIMSDNAVDTIDYIKETFK